MKPFDVISIGSCVRDVMFYSPQIRRRGQQLTVPLGAKINSDQVHFEYGGGAANTAINFRGLGLRAGVIATVGNDFDGQAIMDHLRHQRVDVSFMKASRRHRTGFSFLEVDQASGEHTAFVYYGASEWLEIPVAKLRAAAPRWLYVSSLNVPNWRQLMQQLVRRPSLIAWNPGQAQLQAGAHALRPLLSRIEVFILNLAEARQLTHSQATAPVLAKLIQQWGPRIVVVTCGRQGAYAFDGSTLYREATPPGKPVDTTGAGDCFGSSFVTGLIKYHGDIQQSMQLATVNATALVHVVGAQNGLLKWSQLPARLRK